MVFIVVASIIVAAVRNPYVCRKAGRNTSAGDVSIGMTASDAFGERVMSALTQRCQVATKAGLSENQDRCGTAIKNASPKMVMPMATAAIGNKICIAASRPLMPPVQVSNGCEIHSPNGAA